MNLNWNDKFEKKCGRGGVVVDTHKRGTVKVQFADKSWLWCPKGVLIKSCVQFPVVEPVVERRITRSMTRKNDENIVMKI